MFEKIVEAISTVGFPIIAYVGMFYLVDKRLTGLTEEIKKLKKIIRKDDDCDNETERRNSAS